MICMFCDGSKNARTRGWHLRARRRRTHRAANQFAQRPSRFMPARKTKTRLVLDFDESYLKGTGVLIQSGGCGYGGGALPDRR